VHPRLLFQAGYALQCLNSFSAGTAATTLAAAYDKEFNMRAARTIRIFAPRRSSRRALASGLILSVCAIGAAAAGLGLKPGLWEIRIVKSVIDGRDDTASIAAMSDRMQQMLASLPADQRALIEAKLRQSGIGHSNNGGFRICVSPAMARLDKPIIDKDGKCQPAAVKHDGTATSYEFKCTADGTTTTGKGTATASGETITTHVEMTVQQAGGQTHAMQNDSQMVFVSADCGGLAPSDAVAPGAAPSAAAPSAAASAAVPPEVSR